MDGSEHAQPRTTEASDVWTRSVEPSRLLVWASRWRTPDPEVLTERFGGAAIEALPIDPPVRWAVAVHPASPDRSTRLLWVEDADPGGIPGGPEEAARAECVVGLETLLPTPESGDPWREWLEMVRALDAVGAVGPILDPITGRWFDRETLAIWIEAIETEDDPMLPEELLWSVRATRRDGGRGVWLATEGLARLGRPELEMLETPEAFADAAAALLDGLAGLACEAPPPRHRAWTVGPKLAVAARTPEEVLETVDAGSAGSREHRGGRVPAASGGMVESVMVCGTEPRGRYRGIWTAPLEVLDAVAAGAAIHRSERASVRQRRLAQRHLDLVDAASGSAGAARILIAGGDEASPSIWGVVVQSLGDRWSVQPVDLAGRPAIGEPEAVIARKEVVDWRVEIGGEVHGPEEAGRLRKVLAEGAPGVSPTADGSAS